MGELEKLKGKPPYSIYEYIECWREGVQAAWDAGWRSVPSEEELRAWFRGLDTAYVVDTHSGIKLLRQWLLERLAPKEPRG